jgi:hypothetical protein
MRKAWALGVWSSRLNSSTLVAAPPPIHAVPFARLTSRNRVARTQCTWGAIARSCTPVKRADADSQSRSGTRSSTVGHRPTSQASTYAHRHKGSFMRCSNARAFTRCASRCVAEMCSLWLSHVLCRSAMSTTGKLIRGRDSMCELHAGCNRATRMHIH